MSKDTTSKKEGVNRSSFSKIHLAIFLVGFFVLILLSEFIYRLNNRPQLGVHDYLEMASSSAQKSNVKKTLDYLGKASELRLESEVIKEHPGVEIQSNITIPLIPKNKDIQEAFSSYLKSIDYEEFKKIYASRWARIYYNLGHLAYEQNEPELVVPFWEIAANLGPEWSYFHVELANYYLSQGEIDKARESIGYCMQFQFPKDHCREFLEKNIEAETVEPVGSWEEQINEI